MLKPSATRAFSTLSRRPFWRRSRPPEHGTIQIQRVHFSKPPLFTVQRATRTILYVGPALLIWHFFSPIQIDVEFDKKQGADGSVKTGPDEEEEEKKDEEDEEATFLPMTWPKKLPRVRYTPTDPEYQAITKFQKDRRIRNAVTDRFTVFIRRTLSSPRLLGPELGEVDIHKGDAFVWTIAPSHRPSEYGVSGLFISDEFIGWATKVMPEEEYRRMKAAILPTGAFHSFYRVSKNMLKRLASQDDSIDGKAGISVNKGASSEQLKSLREQLRKGSPAGNPSDQGTARGNGPASSSKDPQDPTASNSRLSVFPSLSSGNRSPPTHLLGFLQSFKRSQPSEIPRGCVVVHGVIELYGTKKKVIVEARAFYDLRTDQFHVQVASRKA